MPKNKLVPSAIRKLIGGTFLVLFILIYVLIATGVGQFILVKPNWIQYIYFPTAGLLWVPFAYLIIRWIYR